MYITCMYLRGFGGTDNARVLILESVATFNLRIPNGWSDFYKMNPGEKI
jgi:hypothetical protein